MTAQKSLDNFGGIDLNQADLALNAIKSANKIVIISHRNPDPDAIGSNLALRHALISLNKQVYSACVDEIPTNCQFLAEHLNYECLLDLENIDLIISVDCGSKSQVAFGEKYPNLFNCKPFINIDHHISNENYGNINLLYTELSSTCQIIFHLLQYWKIPLNNFMATCLLFGLYYDTGSFFHSNTDALVFEVAENLMQNGADLNLIKKNLYQNFHQNKFHLWGEVLSNLKLTEDKIIMAAATEETLEKHQANNEDLSGIIALINSVEQSKYAVFLQQNQADLIKGSLRTSSNELDTSQIAKQFNKGGGHAKASGFSINGTLKHSEIWEIK